MAEKIGPASSIFTLPPIYKLDVDILWKIFWMNTDIFAALDRTDLTPRVHPMDVLRRISQVCRFWREVTLGSPVLWGRVIELDGLRRRLQWGRELVARATQAPLCIKGIGSWADDAECRHFFTNLLDEQWSTIQRLYIVIETPLSDCASTGATESAPCVDPWEPLCRPAPLLESFRLESFRSKSNPQIVALTRLDRPFFADHAPRLREFGIWAFRGQVQQSVLQAPWLKQLRSLMLPSTLSAIEILEVLVHMPLLEKLDLRGTTEAHPSDRLEGRDTISLPLLHQLDFTGTIGASYLFLRYIRPSSICSLVLGVHCNDSDRRDNSSTALLLLCDQISQYVAARLTGDQILFIKKLTIIKQIVIIILEPANNSKSSSKSISVAIRCTSGIPAPMISHLFAPLLNPSQFTCTHIEEIYLGLRYAEASVEEVVADILRRLFSSVNSVICMQVWSDIFRVMPGTSPAGNVTQSAQILTLKLEDQLQRSEELPELLLRFLRMQVGIDKPVQTLRLLLPWYGLNQTQSQPGREWRFLDEISGLRVTWGDGVGSERNDRRGGEYICGSGTPETLDFDVRPTLAT